MLSYMQYFQRSQSLPSFLTLSIASLPSLVSLLPLSLSLSRDRPLFLLSFLSNFHSLFSRLSSLPLLVSLFHPPSTSLITSLFRSITLTLSHFTSLVHSFPFLSITFIPSFLLYLLLILRPQLSLSHLSSDPPSLTNSRSSILFFLSL